MSLYNMLHGMSPITFYVLPLLGKHPNEYPRFRDCFMGDDSHSSTKDKIHIYTRVGGGNREEYESEIAQLRSSVGYVADYDDSVDSTYAMFVFDIPDEFKPDVKLVLSGKIKETSDKYKAIILKTFPSVADTLKEVLFSQSRLN